MNHFICEICGNTEMKKIDDTTFECQNCGVQYDSIELEKEKPIFEKQPPSGEKKAEKWLRYCGIMGLTPYTFILGIGTAFLIGKAKRENGGVLSKKAKRYVVFGVGGFTFWMGAFILFLSMI